MELQRILAKDSRSAMDQVNKLFGQDALVISNKRAKNKTELIVAVDLENNANEALEDIQMASPSSSKNDIKTTSTTFDEVLDSSVFNDLKSAHDNESSQQIQTHAEKVLKDEAEQQETRQAKEIVSLVKSELSVMRREILLSQQLATWPGIEVVSYKIQPLIKALSETGLSLSLRTLITSVVSEVSSVEDAIIKITEIINANLATQDILTKMSGNHLFAGSPGAGKTMMIAKMARQKAAELGEQNVAVVSYRDSRIGAWNQIQLLCGQAGVESYKATTLESLEIILEELSEKSLILIDTCGDDALTMNDLNIKKVHLNKHLIVSSDASEASIARFVKQSNTQWSSVLLSRYNQDIDVWPIINALINKSVPLSIANEDGNMMTPLKQLNTIDLVSANIQNMQLSLV
jgi:flagellar biosynthesis protein FlhF